MARSLLWVGLMRNKLTLSLPVVSPQMPEAVLFDRDQKTSGKTLFKRNRQGSMMQLEEVQWSAQTRA
jgi:hypothetical protein